VIAIDSSVMIDLVGADARAAAAEDAVRAALSLGPVVACDVVISEVVAGLGSGSVLLDALDESGIHFSPLELRAAVRAGEMQRRYKERLRTNKIKTTLLRSVPDFLIGAHAMMQCTALITRDDGFYRDYFKGLKLIVPKAL
jgi:predicted nucleic acid-binding protein